MFFAMNLKTNLNVLRGKSNNYLSFFAVNLKLVHFKASVSPNVTCALAGSKFFFCICSDVYNRIILYRKTKSLVIVVIVNFCSS